MKQASKYNEDSIRVLKGLEPVRKMPDMYTRTSNPNHIIQEVIDNAQDEALAKASHYIKVELCADGSVEVEDDGRGIPVGKNKELGIPVAEVVFTSLHAGGKFAAASEESAYDGMSGGLHGVGVSVTNALSKRVEVTIWREGKVYELAFADGITVTKLHAIKPNAAPPSAQPHKKSGTLVKVWPDLKFFDSPIDKEALKGYVRSRAALLQDVHVVWKDSMASPPETKEWKYKEGPLDLLKEHQGNWLVKPWRLRAIFGERSALGIPLAAPEGFTEGEGVDMAVGWAEGASLGTTSYVNLIATPEGGWHETGLRSATASAVLDFIQEAGLASKEVVPIAEDACVGLSFVLSAYLKKPRFENQTKDRLKSRSGQQLLLATWKDALSFWLREHRQEAEILTSKVLEAAKERLKAKKAKERKREAQVSLPGKLADCESRNPQITELFLVEGDSAAGSAKQGRNQAVQAILPLRGKLLNTWETDMDDLVKSETIANITAAIGVRPHSMAECLAETADLSGLRYAKVCIMADADVDGYHIQVLILTLFLRHFPALIRQGHVYVARSPLYRVDAPLSRKGIKPKALVASDSASLDLGFRRFYALAETELEEIRGTLSAEGLADHQIEVYRFKGLGEMNSDQLWDTTLNPAHRRLLRIRLGDAVTAEKEFDLLMGKRNAAARREWLEQGNNEEAKV